jgi:biopolymer transport protein ExbD
VRDPATQVIEPLRAVLERPMLAADPAAAEAAMAAREITVLADKSLPYEVVKKVMATCTAATYGKMSLAVMEKEKPVAAGSPSRA